MKLEEKISLEQDIAVVPDVDFDIPSNIPLTAAANGSYITFGERLSKSKLLKLQFSCQVIERACNDPTHTYQWAMAEAESNN